MSTSLPEPEPRRTSLPAGAPQPPRAGWQRAICRWVPAIDALRTYNRGDFGHDLIAGLTVAAVALPQAMAYAQIAGLPPQYGLYTAIVMTAVGAIFDSSRQLINGPTNAISIAVLSALTLAGVPEPTGDPASTALRVGAAISLALLVGLVQCGITLLRLGDLSRYISHAVIVGFTLGAAVLLVMDQLKNLLGLPKIGSGDDHFLVRFWRTMTNPNASIHPTTLAIGLSTIAIVVLLRLANQKLRWRVPEFLLTVALMAAIVAGFGLDQQGVKTVGKIPASLPSFGVPQLEWKLVRPMFGSAMAIAMLGLLEAIAMAKAIASQTQQKLDLNQQCLSEGLANVVGSFFQCFPGSGSLTRSTINQQAGGRTQWSGVISAAAVAGTMLLLAPYAQFIPQAALAGILFVSAWRLVDRGQLMYHLRATRFDATIVALTAIAAVAVSIEFCVLIGVFLSFVLYVPRAARVHLSELTLTPERVIRERVPADQPCGRILIYSLEGELFFGAAPSLEEHLDAIAQRAAGGTRAIVLRVKRARNPDAVCLNALEQYMHRLDRQGITVLLCGVRHDFAAVLKSSGFEARLGPQRIFHESVGVWSSTMEAIREAYSLLAGNVCESCPQHAESLAGKDGWSYMI